ncbi:MAG: glycosyltransferase [Bacteroidota bacterium]
MPKVKAEGATKKVLIITYYWPPAGGITVLRCLKIAKYLRQFGWEPIIYTAENAHYPFLDPSNEKDVPADLTVIRRPIWEPYAIYKKLTGKKKDANVNNVFYVKGEDPGLMHRLSVWIRSNFFIPDARASWIKPSVKFLLNYLQEHPVDAIFSDGPPHTNTRIATIVSQKTGIPWLADFQDPWTQVDYYQLLSLTKWGDKKHHRLEQESFHQAAAMTIVSPTWKKELEEIGARNVHVIPWGYDPDDYQEPTALTDHNLRLTHIGIMGYDRNPQAFFRVLAQLKTKNHPLVDHISLQLIGQVDYSVKETYEENNLEDQVVVVGSVAREKALAAAGESAVLLLLLNQQDNAKGRIPGKLFEYLALRRPILAFGPTDSDVARILTATQSGICLDYEDEAGTEQALLRFWEQYQNGSLFQPTQGDIAPYSIIELTKKIAGLLDEISEVSEVSEVRSESGG